MGHKPEPGERSQWPDFQTPRTQTPVLRPMDESVHVELPGGHHADGVSVLISGDWASVREFAAAADIPPARLYGSLHGAIAGADLAVVNLECPLGAGEPIVKDGPNFGCEASCAAALAASGWHVASLANNHVYDQGAAGLASTLEACQAAGLLTVGAGADVEQAMAPRFVDVRGVRVGLLALADQGEGMAGRCAGGAASIFDVHVLDRCRQARQDCDVLLVIPHGGKEYAPFPPPYWYEHLLAIATAGADAVIGHHPHVPQGVTLATLPGGRCVPVVFSTGNFVFPPRPATNVMAAWMSLGYLVELRVSRTGVVGLTLRPYFIAPPDGLRGLQDRQVASFATFMRALSDPLSDPATVAEWFDASVDHFWTHEWHSRVEGLTARLCRDDIDGLRHGRSHFLAPAHATLIDRAIERKIAGTFGQSRPELTERLEGWFAGRWPTRLEDYS